MHTGGAERTEIHPHSFVVGYEERDVSVNR